MDIVKELREGDKILLKKVEDLEPLIRMTKNMKDYEKFVGKPVTVKTILDKTDNDITFEIEEDEEGDRFVNLIFSKMSGFDKLATKQMIFGQECVEKILPREETKTTSIKEKAITKVLLDFVDWIDEHTRINGTGLYQDYLKAKGKENE